MNAPLTITGFLFGWVIADVIFGHANHATPFIVAIGLLILLVVLILQKRRS